MIRKTVIYLLIISVLCCVVELYSETTSSLAELKAETELAKRIEDLVKPFTEKVIVGVDLDLRYNLFETNTSDFKFDPNMSLPGLPVGKTDNRIVENDLEDVVPTEILRKKISIKVPLDTSKEVIEFLNQEIHNIITIDENKGDILQITPESNLTKYIRSKNNRLQTYFFLTLIAVMILMLNNIRSGMRIIAKSMRKIKITNLEVLNKSKTPEIINNSTSEQTHPRIPLEPIKVKVLQDEEEDLMPTRFDFLEDLSDANLLEVLREENPEDIAFIVSQISPEKAGAVFQNLKENKEQVINAMLENQSKLKLDLKILVVNLYNKYLEIMEKEAIQLEGVGLLAKIINSSDYESSNILYESINNLDKDKAKEIAKKIFLLDDVLLLSNIQIEQISLEFTHLELVKFLACVNTRIKNKFFSQLSERATMIFKEDIESLGKLSEGEKRVILNHSLRKIRNILNF